MPSIFNKILAPLRKNSLQHLLANMGHMVFENVLKLFVGFFVSIWVARELGPERFGHFNYVISFCTLFAPFFVMGVDDLQTKELVEKPKETDEIMANILAIKILGGIIGIIFCIGISQFLQIEIDSILPLIYLYSLFQFSKIFDVINTWFLSQIKAKTVTVGRNIILILSAGLKAYCLLTQKDWNFFVYISCFDLAALGFFYLLAYRLEGKVLKPTLMTSKKMKTYFRTCLPLFMILFFTMAIAKIDHLMIQDFLGSTELGKYSAAVKLVDLWHFIPIAIVSTLFPRLIAANQVSISRYQNHKLTILSLMFWTGTIFALVVSLLSSPIINLLYGQKYLGSDEILKCYAWLAIFVFLTFVRVKIFLMQNRTYDGVLLLSIILVHNVLFNYLLIPRYGTKGAVIASIAAYLAADILLSIFHKNLRESFKDIFRATVHPLEKFRN